MEIEQFIELAHKKRFSGEVLAAEKLYLKAANQGSGHAAHELGILCATGGDDLKTSKEKSQFWLQKSLDLGFEEKIASDPEWFKQKD